MRPQLSLQSIARNFKFVILIDIILKNRTVYQEL